MVQTPVYNCFFSSIRNNGCGMIANPLIYRNGTYQIDFADLEQKAADPNVKVLLLCNPHNPAGRVWTKQELTRIGDICIRNNVWVVADEIHCELVFPGHTYIPFASISQEFLMHSVTCTSPSKAFNLAGLVGSYHIIYNPYLRDRVRAKSSKPHYNDMNVLSMHALIGAYKPEGYEWVEELRETISGNVNFACDYITQHFEGVSVSKPEGTYMLFLDCTDWCKAHGKTIAEVEKAGWNVGVAWQDGRMFHGPCAIRMNLALPLTRVQEAFERLDKYVFNGEWV